MNRFFYIIVDIFQFWQNYQESNFFLLEQTGFDVQEGKHEVVFLVHVKWPKIFQEYMYQVSLTHLCLASHKRDIGKQYRPRSDAA